MEKKYIYLLLTKGNDGKFTMHAFPSQGAAHARLEMYIEAQKEIEGLGDNVCVDYHQLERLILPEFILGPGDVLEHVTVSVSIHYDGRDRITETDRYIVRVPIS